MQTHSFAQLIEHLTALPSIGEKTAHRLALHILRAPSEYAVSLAEAIQVARAKMRFCLSCQDLCEEEKCRICCDDSRDTGTLCVIEDPESMQALEKTGQYRGRYHILHGKLSPFQTIGPEELQFERLHKRVQNSQNLSEVILALNSDPEGEATALFLKEYLEKLPIRVTRIAAGIPIGGQVAYTDPMTLSHALLSRYEV
jgi:recombination protein RecR